MKRTLGVRRKSEDLEALRFVNTFQLKLKSVNDFGLSVRPSAQVCACASIAQVLQEFCKTSKIFLSINLFLE